MDIALSDVGVHVAGSLAAFVVIELCKSLFFRKPSAKHSSGEVSGRRLAGSSGLAVAGQSQRADDAPRPGVINRFFTWIFLFFVKLATKVLIAVLAAGFAVSWLQENVDLATAYRLSAATAETVLMVAFFLVLFMVWWILPIRLFKH